MDMRLIPAICVSAVVLALAPAVATAAGTVFWSNYKTPGAVRSGDFANAAKKDVAAGEAGPEGIAIDAAAGKVYWASTGGNAIKVANLDGSGARVLFPNESKATGVAIDPAGGKLYWTAYGSGAIRVGNLDGTGARNVLTGETEPSGIALDLVGGKLYWGLYGGSAVRVLSLAGGGPTTLFPTEPYVTGVAVDSSAGKVYWTNEFAGNIRVGNLNGSGAKTLIPSAGGVGGIAIDPGAGKIFWAAFDVDAIRTANLDGSSAPQNIITGEDSAFYLALLRAPAPATPPQVSGGTLVGQALSCAPATWAADFGSGLLYRAPASVSYQWLKDGAPIDGATSLVYTAFAAGDYSCRATATNFAGATTQISAPYPITAPPPVTTTPPPPAATTTTTATPVSTKIKQLKAAYDIFYAYDSKRKRNKPTRFKFAQIPSGGTIEVRCHGKGCPFTRKPAKVKGSKANLISLVRRARLARGAYLEVRTSAPGYITEVLRFIAAGSSGARLQRLCLPAAAKKPGKC
jgi:DNA-binding beta-propeller fold protein YncE